MATTGWFWLSSALCAVAACAVPAAAGAKHPCLAGWERGPVNCSGEVLIGVDLRGAHMPDSRFDGAYLAYSNLDGAYLSGSTFDSAFLNKVTLDGVHASGITMRFATLVECKMRHAVLDFADLTGVSSMGCEISLHSATDAELPLRNKVHMPLMPPAVQRLFVGSEGTDRGVAETKETTFPRILASARDVVWIGFTVFTLAFLPYLARKSEEVRSSRPQDSHSRALETFTDNLSLSLFCHSFFSQRRSGREESEPWPRRERVQKQRRQRRRPLPRWSGAPRRAWNPRRPSRRRRRRRRCS